MLTLKLSAASAPDEAHAVVEGAEAAASLLRFQMPPILLYTSSRSLSSLSAMMAPRSFRSRYSLLVSYARKTA